MELERSPPHGPHHQHYLLGHNMVPCPGLPSAGMPILGCPMSPPACSQHSSLENTRLEGNHKTMQRCFPSLRVAKSDL